MEGLYGEAFTGIVALSTSARWSFDGCASRWMDTMLTMLAIAPISSGREDNQVP